MPVTVTRNHQRVKRMMRADVARGQNSAIDFLVEESQSMAPVLTGFLKAHIKQTQAASSDQPKASATSGAGYSGFVNHGTYKTAANPFWTVAFLRMYARVTSFFKR